jgi:hypothetical protein
MNNNLGMKEDDNNQQQPLLQDESLLASMTEQKPEDPYQSNFFTASADSVSTKAYWSRIITEAPYIPGDTEPLIPAREIPWADPVLIHEGLTFGRTHVWSLFMANTAALMYGFSVKPESVVLLRSGKFHQPEMSFLRFLSTAQRIGSWFISGLTNEKSDGYRNMGIVRKLHSHYGRSKAPLPTKDEMYWTPERAVLASLIRTSLSDLKISPAECPSNLLSWSPPLNFSQFDMVMTQFGFIGLLYLFPQSLGLDSKSESTSSGMRAYFHLWAVIGRMLGIEDRFNLALHPDPELFHKIFIQVGIASMKETDETVVCLQAALMDGISKRLPLLFTLKGWTYYGLSQQVPEFDKELFWKEMRWRDKVSYFLLKSGFSLVRKSRICSFLVNFMLAILLQIAFIVYLPDRKKQKAAEQSTCIF